MIAKYSLRSIFRSGGKTALFIVLITALTLIVSLGAGVYEAISAFLGECDADYTTVGVLEYMSGDYPDETVCDPAMYEALAATDLSFIKNDPAVQLWDDSRRALGYIEGYTRRDTAVPDKSHAVVVIGSVGEPDYEGVCSAVVVETLYSYDDRTGKAIIFEAPAGFSPKDGHYYAVTGELFYANSSFMYLRPTEFKNAAAERAGFVSAEPLPIMDVTDRGSETGYTVAESSAYRIIADTRRVVNNSVDLHVTTDLDAVWEFHQGELSILEGRAFSAEEYASGARVCIISKTLADCAGVGVGDTLNLSAAVLAEAPQQEMYFAETGFSAEDTYTVAGITNDLPLKQHYVYIPWNGDADWAAAQSGYTVGTAVVDNGGADGFYARVAPQLTGRLRLSMYDQGYAAVAGPFGDIRQIALMITAVCALVGLAVIILFGFLFVYRQREASEVMLLLGAGRFRAVRYFLYSSGFVVLLAAAIGAAGAYGLSGLAGKLIAMLAESYTASDARFSDAALSIEKMLEFHSNLPPMLFIKLGACVLALGVVSCLAFTLATFVKKNRKRRAQRSPKTEKRTSHMRGGAMKYAVLSIRRGGARTLVAPLVAAAVAMLLGGLSGTSARYENSLREVYADTQIDGYFTDISGKYVGNLVLDGYMLNELYAAGKIEDLRVSKSWTYRCLGVTERDGERFEVGDIQLPAGSYARESFINNFERGAHIIAANDIAGAPEFFYADSMEVEWADGYDEKTLALDADAYESPYPCLVSRDFCAEFDVKPGDTVKIAYYWPDAESFTETHGFGHLELRVAGVFERAGTRDNVYVPLTLYEGGKYLFGKPEEVREKLFGYTFESANFTVPESEFLGEFKDSLDELGFSEVQSIRMVRMFIVLRDKLFNSTVGGIKQYIRYIDVLYPCLYLLIGVIGYVVSYLLVVSRKREFATMRGLGASKLRSFMSFFAEQALLCIVGCAIGAGLWYWIYGSMDISQAALILGFIVCYFIGASVSVGIMNRTSVLEILGDAD